MHHPTDSIVRVCVVVFFKILLCYPYDFVCCCKFALIAVMTVAVISSDPRHK